MTERERGAKSEGVAVALTIAREHVELTECLMRLDDSNGGQIGDGSAGHKRSHPRVDFSCLRMIGEAAEDDECGAAGNTRKAFERIGHCCGHHYSLEACFFDQSNECVPAETDQHDVVQRSRRKTTKHSDEVCPKRQGNTQVQRRRAQRVRYRCSSMQPRLMPLHLMRLRREL
jgi:hypothetical protein